MRDGDSENVAQNAQDAIVLFETCVPVHNSNDEALNGYLV